MVSGCGFAVCDETGAVKFNSPTVMLKKATRKVFLTIQPFAVLNM
jgi:hypothetical protein